MMPMVALGCLMELEMSDALLDVHNLLLQHLLCFTQFTIILRTEFIYYYFYYAIFLPFFASLQLLNGSP